MTTLNPTHTRTYQRLVAGTTINPTTLLATDYLNHFNEIVMFLDMMPDAPEFLEEARAWRPLSYQEHFLASVFPYKELAVQAYEHAPTEYREPFDAQVGAMDALVERTLRELETLAPLSRGADPDRIRHVTGEASRELQDLIARASAIINGQLSESAGGATLDQDAIDSLFD